MKSFRSALAGIELALILPAMLFMTSLFVRNLQPPPYEPAQTARRVVEWFSARPFLCLDIFLIELPFAAVVIGCITVVRSWRADAELRQAAVAVVAALRTHLASVLITGATLVAGVVLAIVALHVMTE